ncbi:conserved protein of unknown function [Georgfuchsia toluolica]|uniref:Uncharacterized protein n=1 Tax=Georgfuchsia toluolica TaxID=424218 RepID=A0A916J6U5_9PROT|nr:hypothetical protein [Georgfuchsia toluolica]CAG4885301.1 conserved protein of unknown function [Georgfuchsia toluolica]
MSDFESFDENQAFDEKQPDVLGKVDEFMKRRRAQAGSMAVDIPLHAEPVDDIPMLTEVVGETGLQAKPPHDDLNRDIAHALDAWLDKNLPQAVVRVMDGITDNLILQIQQSADKDLLPRLKQVLLGNVKNSED